MHTLEEEMTEPKGRHYYEASTPDDESPCDICGLQEADVIHGTLASEPWPSEDPCSICGTLGCAAEIHETAEWRAKHMGQL